MSVLSLIPLFEQKGHWISWKTTILRNICWEIFLKNIFSEIFFLSAKLSGIGLSKCPWKFIFRKDIKFIRRSKPHFAEIQILCLTNKFSSTFLSASYSLDKYFSIFQIFLSFNAYNSKYQNNNSQTISVKRLSSTWVPPPRWHEIWTIKSISVDCLWLLMTWNRTLDHPLAFGPYSPSFFWIPQKPEVHVCLFATRKKLEKRYPRNGPPTVQP